MTHVPYTLDADDPNASPLGLIVLPVGPVGLVGRVCVVTSAKLVRLVNVIMSKSQVQTF